MLTYDREVLVRDVNSKDKSYRLYYEHDMYATQASEKGEPIFFAPCFTHSHLKIHNGIQCFSRVYYRGLVARIESLSERERVLSEATSALDVLLRAKLKGRRWAEKSLDSLERLPKKWKTGLRVQRRGETGPLALYFLGDPIRLPVPLKKQGFMIPRGFSLTVEHLMTAKAFKC